MIDSFTITLIFIVLVTIVGAFLRGRSRDVCLRDFSGNDTVLKKKSGKIIWGRLFVENSALELKYVKPHEDREGHLETSYIMYKNEQSQIMEILRYVEELSPKEAVLRSRILEKVCSPRIFAKLKRKMRSFFSTVKDSLMEVAVLFFGRMKGSGSVGGVLNGQDKYTSKLGGQAIDIVCASYEPILEKYIGKKVILRILNDGNKKEYAGILKDYSSEFIEVLDIMCSGKDETVSVKADIIVSRTVGIIRHSG